MPTIASQITSLMIGTQPFIQTQIKENIKAPRHWPLCGEITGTGEFPAQRASYAENVSIQWRHHVYLGIDKHCGCWYLAAETPYIHIHNIVTILIVPNRCNKNDSFW